MDDECTVGGAWRPWSGGGLVASVEALAAALVSRAEVAELAEAKPRASPSWTTWSRT